jgi:hypothetical protein
MPVDAPVMTTDCMLDPCFVADAAATATVTPQEAKYTCTPAPWSSAELHLAEARDWATLQSLVLPCREPRRQSALA